MKNINSITLYNTTYQENVNITDVDLAFVSWTNNSMYRAFSNCYNLTNVTNINENVTNMSSSFWNCSSLVDAPVIPNSVTNMSRTFSICRR